MSIHDNEQLAARAIESGDYEAAVRLLLPLVEYNSQYALNTLGWVYETGATGCPDKDAARIYYEHAVGEGSAWACLRLGRLLQDGGDELKARSAFEAGAKLDNIECKAVLTQLTDNANVELAAQSIEAGACQYAVRLLLPLAERNSQYALHALGWIYETGATGAPDRDVARSYYERAVAEGSVSACHDLGQLLFGQGEEAQARSAFKAGAERGDMLSIAMLGWMMVKGRGGPADIGGGLVWLEAAAAKGHIFSRRTLLGLEARNAKTIFQKLRIYMKIALLAKEGFKEILRDQYSEKVR